MAVMALALVTMPEVANHKESLLAHMGDLAAGSWLSTLISVDASLVLSGAVLTSFVGVNGLVGRMALDRCLPQFLLKSSRRGTTHRIIIAFFLLSISVMAITRGDLEVLAGVYTLSFLSVMFLFSLGNVLLKIKRGSLKRQVVASWGAVLLSMIAVAAGWAGNAIMKPEYLTVFFEYFFPALLIVAIMLNRIALLRLSLFLSRRAIATIIRPITALTNAIQRAIDRINAQQIVFFTRGDNIANLNRVMLYVERNEHTRKVKMVHVTDDPASVPPKFEEDVRFLDRAYPKIDIEFVIIDGTFSPELLAKLSKDWRIPSNFMFIGCPGAGMTHNLAELGGVRVIV